jgi:hypothetical protein
MSLLEVGHGLPELNGMKRIVTGDKTRSETGYESF